MSGTRRFDLLVVGEINPDIIVADADPTPRFGQAERSVASITMHVGSSSVITAMAAARLGLRTAFVGLAGDDVFGSFVLEAMAAASIDIRACRVVKGEATGVTVILASDVDRAILTASGLISRLGAADVPFDLVRQSRHLHVGSWFLQDDLRPGLPELFGAARRAGTGTSIDPNWDPSERWSDLKVVLRETDLFLPNESELLAIAGAPTVGAAADVVRSWGPATMTVAIKQGAAGGTVVGPEGATSALPPRVEPVDTVGAGDAFDAGFLYGRLADWPADRCLSMATICGSLSTRARGGVEGQPTQAEAMAALHAAA